MSLQDKLFEIADSYERLARLLDDAHSAASAEKDIADLIVKAGDPVTKSTAAKFRALAQGLEERAA